MRDFAAVADQYCYDVIAGTIPACKWVKLCCQRQVEDRTKQGTKEFPYIYDPEKGIRVCKFIEKLPHTQGFKGRITLEPWQVFMVMTVFSWLRQGTAWRRFRRIYTEIPRGNGKSITMAAIGLYMAFMDGEPGAEVYVAAVSKDQTKHVWELAAKPMSLRTPKFLEKYGIEVLAHSIFQLQTTSFFKPLASKTNTLDSLNIHFGIIDELHAHPTREVYESLDTGTSKRNNSMLWCITTAGSNRSGICYDRRTYLCDVLRKKIKADTWFGVIYSIDTAYSEQVSDYQALSRIRNLCTCAPTIPTERPGATGYASNARNGNTEQPESFEPSGAPTIPTSPSRQRVYARGATTSNSSTETPSTESDGTPIAETGSDTTQASEEPLTASGSPSSLSNGGTTANLNASTESHGSSLTSKQRSKGTSVPFAKISESSSLTTTTSRGISVVCSAANATAESVSSETLKKEYDKHSPTCRVKLQSKLDGKTLTVKVPDDDWASEESLKKANPNWGISIDINDTMSKLKEAMTHASAAPNFKTKHLNVWVGADHAWMDLIKWNKCIDASLSEDNFKGKDCIIGLDLASKLDLLAAVRIFWSDNMPDDKRHYYAFGTYWTNEENVTKSQNSSYRGWETEGRLEVCPGATNNYNTVEDWIKDNAKQYQVLEIAHDPYQAVELVQHLMDEGITMVEIPQMPKYLSEPMKELEAAVYDGRFHFDGDPILTWAISNVVAHADKNDNLFPNKERPENKIDPATALFTALNRVIAQVRDTGENSIDCFGSCYRCGTLTIGVENNGTFTFLCDEHKRSTLLRA